MSRWGDSIQVATLRTVDCGASKQAQAITFASNAPAGALPQTTYLVRTTHGGSTQPVVLSVTTPGTCRVKGAKVSFIKNGTCTIAADQAGDRGFDAAPRVTQDVQVGRIPQTITFGSTPPAPATVGGDYPVSATGGASGNPIRLTTNPTICTIEGTTVHFVRTGKCTVQATQVGNSRYAAAPAARQVITVVKAPAGS